MVPASAYVCVFGPVTDSAVPSPQSMSYEPVAGMVMSSLGVAVFHVVLNAVEVSVTVTSTSRWLLAPNGCVEVMLTA